MPSSKRPAVPEPLKTIDSHQQVLMALKEGVEQVLGQRGPKGQSMPTWDDLVRLGVVAADQVPKS